jgi:uncharacterized protein YndB with AHSA1/START domain
MEKTKKQSITVQADVKAPVEKVWKLWTDVEHVKQWNSASPDWHTPNGRNDLRVGGTYSYTMAAKDGSVSFDFGGTYTKVDQHRVIESKLGDDRMVKVIFEKSGSGTRVVETFDAEEQNSVEMQRGGWQAILDNFKKYAEEN